MSDQGNVLGKWPYGTTPQFPYGEDTTYRKAMAFLDGPYIIEDWGCGTAYARRFVKQGRYIGIDGSWSMHCDHVADLRIYRSNADAILMRHILEHNYDWRKVLENALASFRKKFALVMFTPFSDVTHSVGSTREGIPDLSFRKQDLLEVIGSLPFTEESALTGTQYGTEHIFYITRQAKEIPKPSSPRVSIIIPTYNHLKDLLEPNLESMREVTNLEGVEVIVVANGCSDGTEDYVRSLGATFKVLSYPEPLGYTKATNEGIKVSRGEYLIFLNNDVLFLEQPKNQWIEQLLEPFEGNPKMGITGPLQFRDWYAEEDVIVGSCLCISRAALQAAGGLLDEIYSPGGGEDIDLCCKVRGAGFVVRQIPKEAEPGKQWTNVDGKFMMWHKNNQTFKDVPDYWDKIVMRNGIINMKRYNKNIKLCLGARGEDPWPYASVDVHPTPPGRRAPLVMDLAHLDLEDGTVAEILSIDPDEYIGQNHIQENLGYLFLEWHRVIRTGGKLIVEVPDGPYAEQEVRLMLERAGFRDVTSGPALHPPISPAEKNIRLEATKP